MSARYPGNFRGIFKAPGSGPRAKPSTPSQSDRSRSAFIIKVMAASPNVRWDLSALFSGMDDPKIAATWETCLSRADRFAERFRDTVDRPDVSPEHLAEGIREMESIYQEASKPANYAQLLMAADSADPKIGAFLAAQMERLSELQVKIMFFELEIQDMDDEVFGRLLGDSALDNYRHYLQVARKYRPHKLSEEEEIILEETANTGCRAWVRLYEEVLANHVFRLNPPGGGEVRELTEEETTKLLRDPSREMRQAAADALTQGLDELERVVVFTFNNLVQDKRVGDRLRSHPYPEHSRHLANELEKSTVDLVIDVCRSNYGLVERYYRVKREILGLPELTHIDRYAPLFPAKAEVPWDQGRDIVLDAFGSFSPTLAARAREFFDQNWIDAESRKGKQGGAFCSYNTPDTHPVVFQTYQSHYDDVMTLAHELGHGAHASLSRAQTYLNFHGTLPLAELASTFGEMLVFEKIVAGATPEDRLALYGEKIETIFATVFRQSSLFAFEQRAHEARREEGELSPDRIGEIWQGSVQEMFGDAIQLGDQHRGWWAMVGHFFFAPFYVYAYSFGELLALSLFEMAKQGGSEFEQKYIELLRLGGSRSPQELMATVGVDLDDRAFWEGGVAAIERLVEAFERQWAELGPRPATTS